MSTSQRLRAATFTVVLVACFAPVKGYTYLATRAWSPIASASTLRAAPANACTYRRTGNSRTGVASVSTRKHITAE